MCFYAMEIGLFVFLLSLLEERLRRKLTGTDS